MMITALAFALVLAAPQDAVLTGTLAERPVSDSQQIRLDFKPSTRTDLPDPQAGDRVLATRVRSFDTGAAGFDVVLVERKGTFFLYTDRDRAGRLSPVAEMRDTTGVTSWDYTWEVPQGPSGTLLPLKARLAVDRSKPFPAWHLYVPTGYRLEGHVEIGGRRTLVSMPFRLSRSEADVRNGHIGIDADGDGKISTSTFSGEYVLATGEPVVLRAGERFISIESTDYAKRTFVVRERAASEYKLIEVRVGSPLADFAFVDFDGRSRKLSELRGKWVLLDFWGSWCKPCVDDVPMMKEAYAKLQARGLEILGIDYEMSGSAEKVRPFLKEKDVRWINATPESVRELVNDRFRITGFPTLILLDPQGVVVETRSTELRGKKLLVTLEKFVR